MIINYINNMNWLGIHEWVWILIFCAIGCVLFNPILYFIKWELYNRKEWIERKIEYHDINFFRKSEHAPYDWIQINEVRPRTKDIYNENDDCFYWWFPGFSYFVFLYLFFYLIFRPTKEFWKRLIKRIGEIKV